LIDVLSQQFTLLPLKERLQTVKDIDEDTFAEMTELQRRVVLELWTHEMVQDGELEYRNMKCNDPNCSGIHLVKGSLK